MKKLKVGRRESIKFGWGQNLIVIFGGCVNKDVFCLNIIAPFLYGATSVTQYYPKGTRVIELFSDKKTKLIEITSVSEQELEFRINE